MTKLEVFRRIYDLYSEAEDYINQVPSDLNTFFFENTYSNNREMIVDVLMRAYFTESENESVYWFLYEWHNNKDLTISIDDHEYKFNTIDDYIDYLKQYEGW